MKPTTVVVAHRTVPRHAPENSLEGVRLAASLGADYVEVDVRRTHDGVPVLLHDRRLWRTARRPWRIDRVPSSALARHRLSNGEPVPTLRAALEAAPARLGLALDIKDPGAGPATLAVVHDVGALDRVLLWAQDADLVGALVAEVPGAQVALLRDTFTPHDHQRLIEDAVALGAGAISAHEDAVTPGFVDAAHRRGLVVYSWFRSLETQREKLALVDGVVTDWPEEARAQIDAPPSASGAR